MRISKDKEYRITTHSQDTTLLGKSVLDSGFRNLDAIYSTAVRSLSDMDKPKLKFVGVYCVDDDTYNSYKVIGGRLIKN